MDALLAELTAIAGPEHVLTDPDLVAGYATDWTRRFSGLARCVIRPGEVREVAAVLLACARHGVPVVPQGGNTGLVGGGVPVAPGARAAWSCPPGGCAGSTRWTRCRVRSPRERE